MPRRREVRPPGHQKARPARFTDGLRIELQAENAPVSVTLIKPAAINTDFAHHARNYTEREPMLPPLLYAPREVAHGILLNAYPNISGCSRYPDRL